MLYYDAFSLLASLLLVFLLVLQDWIVWQRRNLNWIAGPLLWRFTNLWRYIDVRRGNHHHTIIALHRNYGSLVRIGPNAVSIADAGAIPLIYGISRGFIKARAIFMMLSECERREGKCQCLIKNEAFHQRVRKPIAKAYAMTAVAKYEPLIDEVIMQLIRRLSQEYGNEKPCNLGEWVQYFAFDVMTTITFGEAFGFLEAGKDLHDLIHLVDEGMDKEAPNSQMPWMGHLKSALSLSKLHKKDDSIFPSFVLSRIQQREQLLELGRRPTAHEQQDFLDQFLVARETEPEDVTSSFVWCFALTNVVAGSDTVAIPLRTIVYHVMKSPKIYETIMRELKSTRLSIPVSWKDVQRLSYLDAIVREALRFHPPVSLGPERVVPSNGLQLEYGSFFPPGTLVSMNAWVLHRSEEIFGPQVDEFHPERWLQGPAECDEKYEKRLKQMGQSNFTFGYGLRTCIGKNISLLEIFKVIPSLFLSLDLKLMNAKWETWNSGFVRQKGLEVQLRNL